MLEVTNIFNSNMDNQAFPQATYLFKVVFDGGDTGTADKLNEINAEDEAVSMTATLPKSSTKTVTQWYKGTPKTRIVNMDRSGDTTLTFVVRRTGLGKLGYLFSLAGYDLEVSNEFKHDEFSRMFTKLTIYTLKSHMFKSDYINTKGDLDGNLTQSDSFDEEGELIKEGNVSTRYELYNCIVTDYSFTELSYDSSDYVKLTVTVHYDYWCCR